MKRLHDEDDFDTLRDFLSIDFLLLTILFTWIAAIILTVAIFDAYMAYRWPVTLRVPNTVMYHQFNSRDHSEVVLHPDVKVWLTQNRMRVRPDRDVRSLQFRSERDAVLFKMRWL